MADYHPLIARAVAGLEKNSGENRRALYERARVALVAQLRGVQPALDESEITRERLALEEAIRKVEAEAARAARETMRPTIKRPEQPRREDTPRATPRPPPLTPSTLSSPRSVAPAPPPAGEDAAAPAQPRPGIGNRRTLQDEALRGFRDNSNAEPPRPPSRDTGEPSAPSPPQAPERPPEPATPERSALEEYGQLEPQTQPDHLWALPLDSAPPEPPVDLDAQQPPPPSRMSGAEQEEDLPRRPPRSYAGMIRLGLALVLLAAIGSLLYWQRDTIAGVAGGVMAMFRSSPSPAPREAATPSRPKITDRIGQPSSQATSGPPVAQRVVLYEEEPDDPQGKRFVGTVLWRTEMRPASPGRPPELAVRGDVEVPDRKMSVTMSIRRNTDASLPASHTIEIVFTLPSDTPSGGVQKVPGVLMKQAEQTRGVPLAGLAVPVTPGYFLIGLSSLESDMQRNLQLLKERAWFDIPIIYNNNRRAILALEKGTPGEQVFNQAFAAWRQ
jgi:hypothetical protein